MQTSTGNKAERSYVFIKEHITSGAFSPGYRLVLGQLAKVLAVSVVPVREAIRRLEAEGLVTFTPNVGAEVVSTSHNQYRYTMETLSLVEGFATALAAPRLNHANLRLARNINRQMRDCLRGFQPARFTELNHEFHAVIFEHCDNLHILDLVHRGWARLATIRESTFGKVPLRAYSSVEEHEHLLELIEQSAPALEIEIAARNHRLATMEAYLDAARRPDPSAPLVNGGY